jgi:hypothetical protein
MANAMSHSRPPSYRSHVGDHTVIEAVEAGRSGSVTPATNQVQVAQVHQPIAPGTPHTTSRSSSHHQRNHSDEVPGGVGLTGHQEISVVTVTNGHCFGNHSFVRKHHHLHFKQDDAERKTKSGSICDTSEYYESNTFISGSGNHEAMNKEKKSVVTIVQTLTTNTDPVSVTVSGNIANHNTVTTSSSESGSDFSAPGSDAQNRASPTEVVILATL